MGGDLHLRGLQFESQRYLLDGIDVWKDQNEMKKRQRTAHFLKSAQIAGKWTKYFYRISNCHFEMIKIVISFQSFYLKWFLWRHLLNDPGPTLQNIWKMEILSFKHTYVGRHQWRSSFNFCPNRKKLLYQNVEGFKPEVVASGSNQLHPTKPKIS